MALEQGLLDIEMTGTTGDFEISAKIIEHNMHQLLKYDISLDSKSKQLIQILGELKHKSMPKLENKHVNNDRSIMYLYKPDTLWHTMFNKSIADAITTIVFGKYMAGLIVVLSLSYVIDQILQMCIVYHVWYRFPLNLTTIIIATALLISVNKYLFKRSLFTFDFLVKTLYAIRLWICGTIYNNYSVYWSFDYMATTLAIIAISLIDGFPFPNKIKTIATLVIAMNYSFSAFDYTFLPRDPDNIKLFGTFEIDTVSLISGSYRIICLFIWKQAFRTVWNKNNSTTIRRYVKLKWIDS
eukprot:85381_1